MDEIVFRNKQIATYAHQGDNVVLDYIAGILKAFGSISQWVVS